MSTKHSTDAERIHRRNNHWDWRGPSSKRSKTVWRLGSVQTLWGAWCSFNSPNSNYRSGAVIGVELVLKFGQLNDDDHELDAQAAARSIGGVALYAKAKEPQEFGELKRNRRAQSP